MAKVAIVQQVDHEIELAFVWYTENIVLLVLVLKVGLIMYFRIWLCVFKVSVRRMVAVIDGYEIVALFKEPWRW